MTLEDSQHICCECRTKRVRQFPCNLKESGKVSGFAVRWRRHLSSNHGEKLVTFLVGDDGREFEALQVRKDEIGNHAGCTGLVSSGTVTERRGYGSVADTLSRTRVELFCGYGFLDAIFIGETEEDRCHC